jgi:hypothetical protein
MGDPITSPRTAVPLHARPGAERDVGRLNLGGHAIGPCGRLARLTGSTRSPFSSLFGRRQARSSNLPSTSGNEIAIP